MKKYKALLFDFDGTLFDTAALNFRAYKLAYFDLGIEITEEMFAKTNGLSVYSFNNVMGVECDVNELKRLKERYYAELSQFAKPNNYLIQLIKNTDLKTALVTTARRVNIKPLLEKYGLEFDVCITQESVVNHKPNQECYELALKNLGFNADECLAFEDSRIGFVSARSAGIDCVRITEFNDSCIKDMSGGSDAVTKLMFCENSLVVYKKAMDKDGVRRLVNQYNALEQNKNNELFVSARSCEFGMGVFSYEMPYIFAPNLYEYINKTSAISELMLELDKYSKSGNVTYNIFDLRDEFLDNYIIPGMDIYKKITGNELSINIKKDEDIPFSVNSFRITRYHGDTTFENTLVLRDGRVLLIDPVPDGNVVTGIAHDFSKIGQSLMGYEALRDGIEYDYEIEINLFDDLAKKMLTQLEYESLKFYTACLFLRRLKHQQYKDVKLVEVYGKVAERLLMEFYDCDYSWTK